jgi:hypothetical protein
MEKIMEILASLMYVGQHVSIVLGWMAIQQYAYEEDHHSSPTDEWS